MPAKTAAKPRAAAPTTQRRIQVRKSGVHGKGVFALQDIPEGETLIEYLGEIITWKEAQRRHPWNPEDPNHTFYFHVDDGRVIDAAHGGNAARWINHSCNPNCEAVFYEHESGDPKRDQLCIPIAVCSTASKCRGDSCYCGRSFACVSPDGPCREEL